MSSSKVYLVGSGPGDIGLLTLKAHRLIKEADVIVYDRLVSDEIVAEFPQNAKKHYVGKKESEHTIPQDEINLLLVEYSKKYKKVVRLKGGDPFIFGRGGEEIVVLKEHGVDFEVVPGISSSVAGLTYAGIPITHRGVANNFLVMTGHTCSETGLDDINWEALKCVGTVVILMGVRNRAIIAQKLMDAGKSELTPVAFIENATRSDQQVIISDLKNVSLGNTEVNSPAVYVIGETVNFHKDWNWFMPSFEGELSEVMFG